MSSVEKLATYEGDFDYSFVAGFFEHDQQPTGPDFRAAGLGLIERPYPTDPTFDPHRSKTQWERFEYYVASQNSVNERVRFKVFYVTRHGEGVHNVKEKEVGRQEWERYWSRVDGDGEKTWVDAKLTDRGIEQAENLRKNWINFLFEEKVAAPERYYTSPLTRCLETAKRTFTRMELPADRPFRPVVRELLRERHGMHMSDKRGSRSWITSAYPEYEVEPSLTETDELWKPDKRESEDELQARLRLLLDDIFHNDSANFVSLTTHSWSIRALYAITGHPEVWQAAGHVTPIIVRAENRAIAST